MTWESWGEWIGQTYLRPATLIVNLLQLVKKSLIKIQNKIVSLHKVVSWNIHSDKIERADDWIVDQGTYDSRY